jgi:flagellar P-ring protein precursor FlgI
MIQSRTLGVVLTAWLLAVLAAPASVEAKTTLKGICRIKGQEENSLHGLGIVVGLKGTGDGGNFLPTIRSLAQMMNLMGRPITGVDMAKDLKDAKNVALVTVDAIVPAAGARQGDKIDCVVSAIAAKSLAGGRLFITPLMGGRPERVNPRVYAFAEGAIALEDPTIITTGRIHGGCRLEEDFYNVFILDNKITLVLDANHADFEVAQDVAELINSQLGFQGTGTPLAKAINQVNIEVTIPEQYKQDPVLFVSQVLALPMMEPQTGARVVINERSGSIVISGDVDIGAVVVTHKNIVVETGPSVSSQRFKSIETADAPNPKLKSLIECLNSIHAQPADIIDIIKGLERNGKLHAQLIIE